MNFHVNWQPFRLIRPELTVVRLDSPVIASKVVAGTRPRAKEQSKSGGFEK